MIRGTLLRNLIPAHPNRTRAHHIAHFLAWALAVAIASVELWLFHWLFHRSEGYLIGRALLLCGILAQLLVLSWFTSPPRVFVALCGMIELEAALFHWGGHLARAGATYDLLRLVNFLALFVFVGWILIWIVALQNAKRETLHRRVRR